MVTSPDNTISLKQKLFLEIYDDNMSSSVFDSPCSSVSSISHVSLLKSKE